METIKAGDLLELHTDRVRVLDVFKDRCLLEVMPKGNGSIWWDIGHISFSSEYNRQTVFFSPNNLGHNEATVPGGTRSAKPKSEVETLWNEFKAADQAAVLNKKNAEQDRQERIATREERKITILVAKGKAERRLIELCQGGPSANELVKSKEVAELAATINTMTQILRFIR
jgi:hypothetical protein